MIDDAVATLFAADGNDAVKIASTEPFRAAARIFNDQRDNPDIGGTFGQAAPAFGAPEILSSGVLLSQEHPSITFRAERLEGNLLLAGESEVTLVGTMVLLGSAHPVRTPISVSIEEGSAVAETTWPIPYVDWGLEDPSTFVLRVGKQVPVTIRAKDVEVSPGSSE